MKIGVFRSALMSIIPKLAFSLNRRDEVPNQELASEIVKNNDSIAVAELVENLTNKNKNIASDCIKTIYEIGMQKPEMIAPFSSQLIDLLQSKNNRMQWGAMIGLDMITPLVPEKIYTALPKIIEAADKGSVITNDHCVAILVELCKIDTYIKDAFPLYLERLRIAPTNQLASYAEKGMSIINDKNNSIFIEILSNRLPEMHDKIPKKTRIEKVIKTLY